MYFNPIIVLFLTFLFVASIRDEKYFNPIIVLFLTLIELFITAYNHINFNPIIVLFLTITFVAFIPV